MGLIRSYGLFILYKLYMSWSSNSRLDGTLRLLRGYTLDLRQCLQFYSNVVGFETTAQWTYVRCMISYKKTPHQSKALLVLLLRFVFLGATYILPDCFPHNIRVTDLLRNEQESRACGGTFSTYAYTPYSLFTHIQQYLRKQWRLNNSLSSLRFFRIDKPSVRVTVLEDWTS